MERFRRIPVCTTNRMADIDHASIGRFNYKIGFDFLKPQGNVILYERFSAPLTRTSLNIETQSALRRITNLAPGDFKRVRDRYLFQEPGELDHCVLVRALEEETGTKKIYGIGGRIRF